MIIEIENVSKQFKGRHGAADFMALKDVSLTVNAGETYGIVGESGAGKSTLARIIIGLIQPDAGEVRVLDRQINGASAKQLRPWRADMQIVLQNPQEALNPRMRVGDAIAEPLVLHTDMDAAARKARVRELLEAVQLSPGLAERYPHQLSGGQQQRVTIARAIATNPSVVLFDEPTSALDVSVRVELLRLLARIQRELKLTYVMISHDLPTIRRVCDHVAVMRHGEIVETGAAAALFADPQEAYTRYLFGAELPLDPHAELPPLDAPTEPAQDREVVR
jgi:ABC-type glutathione transport system ATPase component